MALKACNSMGFVDLPDNKLNTSGYKGLWASGKVYVPFINDEVYVFDVDEEMVGSEQTCEVIVCGQTARVRKTKNQNYYGNIIDGVLVLNDVVVQ